MELNCKKALMLLNDCKGMAKNDDWILHSICVGDTAGIIAKSLNLYPAHLGPEFTKLYSKFIEDRIAEKHKPKDKRDQVLIEGYKLILNGTIDNLFILLLL